MLVIYLKIYLPKVGLSWTDVRLLLIVCMY